MGKWKKKLRKFAKKAAPLAMLGLGAAALAKRRKTNALNAITDYDVSGGGENRQALAKRLLTSDNAYTDRYTGEPILHGGTGATYEPRSLRSYFGLKKGGRVKGAGCAKRGFGRALKKK